VYSHYAAKINNDPLVYSAALSVDGQLAERLVDSLVGRSLGFVDGDSLCTGALKQLLSKLFVHNVFLELFCMDTDISSILRSVNFSSGL